MAPVTFPELPPVDRRLFVPDDIWIAEDGKWVCLSRHDDPVKWEHLVASKDAITTKLKDGVWPVSSSSSPTVMTRMISALRIKPGFRVLEVGTGTGWNSACLAALGVEVVSIEIDAAIAEQARTNLRRAGYDDRVKVVTGKGELGTDEYAPYDRIISTASVHTIPYPWVEQCSNQGLIVTPYTSKGHKWALLVLTVSEGIAAGGMEGTASFIPLRGQGLSQIEQDAIEFHDDLHVRVSRSGQTVTYARAQ
jgi:protein-L-isoaspartate(D-aspartate) O-methyltransferase